MKFPFQKTFFITKKMNLTLPMKLLIIICLTLIIYIILVQIHLSFNIDNSVVVIPNPTSSKPIVWIYPYGSHLDIVKYVFESIGYIVETKNVTSWSVLWSHVYPFNNEKFEEKFNNLKLYQKINHFPGNIYLVNKISLASLVATYIPKTFKIQQNMDALKKYIRRYPNKLWIQKGLAHRSIEIIDLKNLNYKNNKTFVQEFISNPFLINERKFDIGVYVVLSSVNPLRVYIYSSDVLLRFCQENYYPFESSAVNSYVIGDDYIPIWEIPQLQRFYTDLNYNSKESLNAYLNSQKKNPTQIWNQISDAIQDIFIRTEDSIAKLSQQFSNNRNFFELFRFDFIVDENLKVFLLEVNMSPNLSPAHFAPNRLLYKQVLYNALSVTGLVRKFSNSNSDDKLSNIVEVSDKDLQVFPEECNTKTCNKSCKVEKCHVCFQCMNKDFKSVAESAYLEHMNRNKFRRLIPIPVPVIIKSQEPIKNSKTVSSTVMNKFMDRWYKGKCLQDITFCQ